MSAHLTEQLSVAVAGRGIRRPALRLALPSLFGLPCRSLRVKCAAMTIQAAVADTSTKTVTFGGKTYSIQALSEDSYTVLLAGIPVGRVVYSFGAANGVPEGDAISEDDLYAIAEAWFAAVDG